MKTKFVWLIVSCLIVAALVLASCAPAVVEEKKEVKGVVKEAEKKVEEVEKVAEKVGPQYGGTFYVDTYWEVSNFDDLDAIWQTTATMSYTHNSLTEGNWYYDRNITDFKDGWGYRLNEESWIGALAETWEMVDDTTIIFNIRQGVRWHNKPPLNGREFVADDVVKYYDRLLSAPRFLVHKLQVIDTVTATDKYTVRFDLKEPFAQALMVIVWQKITAQEIYDTYGDARHWTTMIGTGPFFMTDFVLGSSMTFERNPDYWEKDPRNGNQLPYVDSVKSLMIPDPSTSFAALRTGKLDQATYIPWTSRDALSAAAPELSWAKWPHSSVFWIFPKNSIPPTNNLKVRQAMSMAIDRKTISDTLYPPGFCSWEDFPMRKAWAGIYTPFEELSEVGQMVRTYDPVAAKALLAEAGYPNGFDTSIQYHAVGGWAWAEDMLAMIKESWAEIGINLDMRPVDAGTMSSLRYAPFGYDHILGVGGGSAEPFDNINGKYVCGAPWNRAVICDSYVDSMYDKIKVELDAEKRNPMLKELYNYILEQCLAFAPLMAADYTAWWPWVKDYEGEQTINYHRGGIMAHIWLDQDMRREMVGR